MDGMQVVELVAATLGLVYVWLELKASIWLWLVGIILPLFWIYISWHSEVYGNVLVNIYYMIACIWGGWQWLKHRKEGADGESKELPISRVSRRTGWLLLGITILLTMVLAPFYAHFMGSPFPYWDGVATAVSFVGMWLLAMKYMENWYCWVLSNAIYSSLYLIQGYTISGIFFILYTLIAVAGYFNWLKMMKAQ